MTKNYLCLQCAKKTMTIATIDKKRYTHAYTKRIFTLFVYQLHCDHCGYNAIKGGEQYED